MNAQETVYRIVEHLLGKDWYIVDPVGVEQGNEVVLSAIMNHYPPKDMTPVDRWRKRHKQCRWCTHCRENLNFDDKKYEIGVVYECTAKGLEFVNPYKPRPFCTIFNLKKEK